MPQFFYQGLVSGIVELDAAESLHAGASQRLQAGASIRLFDGRGTVGLGRVLPPATDHNASDSGKRGARQTFLRVAVERIEHVPAPIPAITLYVAAPKGDRLEWLIEKCTELGVMRIVLAAFERSVVHPRETRLERLDRIAREACKQCERAWVPRIDVGTPFSIAIAESRSTHGASLLVADVHSSATSFTSWARACTATPGRLDLVVGPEGGLTDQERSALREAGGISISLSEHTLRIETAAVAFVALASTVDT